VLSEDAEVADLTANQRGLILGACAQVCQLSDQMHAEMDFLAAAENGWTRTKQLATGKRSSWSCW